MTTHNLKLRYSPIESIVRSTADVPGILIVVAAQDPDRPFEQQWAIDPNFQPPNSPHVEKAEIIGVRGQAVHTRMNGTIEEVRARVTPITVEEATEAAEDLATLQVLLAYAQSTVVSVVERYASVHVYEAVIGACEWCIEVRDSIAQRLEDRQAPPDKPDQEDPS